jgi:hypothetical protein
MEDDGVVVPVSFGSLLDRATFARNLSGNSSELAAAFRTDRPFTSTDSTIALHLALAFFSALPLVLAVALGSAFALPSGVPFGLAFPETLLLAFPLEFNAAIVEGGALLASLTVSESPPPARLSSAEDGKSSTAPFGTLARAVSM